MSTRRYGLAVLAATLAAALALGMMIAGVLVAATRPAGASARPAAAPSASCSALPSPWPPGTNVCTPGAPPPPTSFNLAYGQDFWFNYTNPCPKDPHCGWRWGQFWTDGNGNARLSGLIRTINPIAHGRCAEIVKLNASYGPDARISFGVDTGAGLDDVDVFANGSVQFCARHAPLPAYAYVTLDGVSWQITGVSR